MYYLFIYKPEDLNRFRKEFNRVQKAINEGKTPVYSELRSAKTNMVETLPYQMLAGLFLIAGTMLLNALNLGTVVSVAVVMIVNSICGCVANYIFTCVKHSLRIKLCKRLGVEPTEQSIAVLESMEYQSV